MSRLMKLMALLLVGRPLAAGPDSQPGSRQEPHGVRTGEESAE